MTRQTNLSAFERPNLSVLTDAEYTAYMAVNDLGRGVREYARETGRSPGTVGNLLARAERKLEENA